jgi:valyl-tRNA synthetase
MSVEKSKAIPRAFDPSEIEGKLYSFWEKSGFFTPDLESSKPPFSIVIPPPNVTGFLHMGHALNLTLQDILARFKRMRGFNVLWVPGTDHAGIATQNVVERELAKEGLSRHDLGREKFLERVWQWKEVYHKRIRNQLKRMGASCDWTRERFTMDEGLSRAVKEVFVRLFEEGFIYQGEYIVNWCPRCETALADIEVDFKEQKGKLYYIRYYFKDDPEKFLTIATTRPETMLGDVAVAVNPEDERYKALIGKVVILPLVGRELPIIADAYVDPKFGTGVLKVTPAHDFNDFELGKRHNLPLVKVIDQKARMTGEAGEFAGLSREECREKIVARLSQLGYLERVEDHTHAVGRCYRCTTVVEPLISKQWFVKMKELATPAIKAVAEKQIEFIPENWEKVYFEWMYNIKDWCISRQIWWGHQIPIFTCEECNFVFAHRNQPERCPKCGGKVHQEEDVLDTWFSSALWPFSTLGWPQKTKELEIFYPTSVLVTGFDIIFFWVARMIMMGLKFTGEVPFRKVYITPLVRDAQGRKMSKSAGNAIDPLEITQKYGVDSLRFALAWLTIQGRDINLSMERIEASRNFMNKLWNASRFVLMNTEELRPSDVEEPVPVSLLDLKDRWILSRLQQTIEQATSELERFNFGEYTNLIYEFVWGEFCDWYIEWCKKDLYEGKPQERRKAQQLLVQILSQILKLLHPIAPYITEEIWQNLPLSEAESIMIAPWPESSPEKIDFEVDELIGIFQAIIREIRFLKSELRIPLTHQSEVIINLTDASSPVEELNTYKNYIETLARCTVKEIGVGLERPEGFAISSTKGAEIYLNVEGAIDIGQELQRLEKKIQEVDEELERVSRRINNPDFLNRAPEETVQREKRRFSELNAEKTKLVRLKEAIAK